jgi:hypothetical protein
MADKFWKTGSAPSRREPVRWPSPGQAVRQLIVAAVIAAIWGGLLAGFWQMTRAGASELPPAEAAAGPTASPTPQPTNTAAPSPTPLPTATPAAINPPELAVPAPTEEAAVEPTATLSPPPTATPAPAVESAGVSFAADVMPLLERRCIKCHGGEKPEGGLRIEEGLDMRTLEGLLAGSINGPVIEPGNAQVSYLVEQITKGEMPKKEPRLLPREIRLITEWINAGAPDN